MSKIYFPYNLSRPNPTNKHDQHRRICRRRRKHFRSPSTRKQAHAPGKHSNVHRYKPHLRVLRLDVIQCHNGTNQKHGGNKDAEDVDEARELMLGDVDDAIVKGVGLRGLLAPLFCLLSYSLIIIEARYTNDEQPWQITLH